MLLSSYYQRLAGAAVRFYVVCMILQRFVLDAYGVPFAMTVVVFSITYLVVHTTRRDTNTRFNRYFPNRLYVSGTSPYYI